jgi:hypothetical protein
VCTPFPLEELPLFNIWQDDGVVCGGGNGDTGCTNPVGTAGQTTCINYVNKICQNKVWANGGNACGSGACQSAVIGQPCSISGAHRCDSGCYLECDGTKWADTGSPCTTGACGVIPCLASKTMCCNPAVDEGCVTGDLLLHYYCDPIEGVCEPSEIQHNVSICQNRALTSIKALVNGFPTDINGQVQSPYESNCGTNWGTCNVYFIDHHHCEPLTFSVTAYDNLNQVMPNCQVRWERVSQTVSGGFVISPGAIDCDGSDGETDSNGAASCVWLRTWETLNNITIQFRLTVTDPDGVVITKTFGVKMIGSGASLSESCDYYDNGSVCKS